MTTAQSDSHTSEGKFCVSRANEPFTPDGFRDWLEKRDFGLAEATNGAYGGQITRAKQTGCTTGRHYHPMNFQLVYVLKGWVKFWYEGEGEFTFHAGDFVYHPPKAAHNLMDYSEDMELFEVFSPSDPGTIDVND